MPLVSARSTPDIASLFLDSLPFDNVIRKASCARFAPVEGRRSSTGGIAAPGGRPLTDHPLVCIFTVVRVEPSPADLQEMSGCVCFALRRATRAVTQFYDRALKPHRLRATQFPI